MIIYTAIDIRGGRCVRLTEGRFDAETVFADDPTEMALKWAGLGAEFLHLVDLDGALAGEGKNVPVIERILQSVSIPVQLGGGIRNLETIEKLLSLGVTRLILGSAAVKNPVLVEEACKKYPGHIAVGIDAKNGEVAIEGWGQGSGVAAEIRVDSMDLIPEAVEFARMGILPAGMYRNRTFAEVQVDCGSTELAKTDVLFDPQTAGGLLIAVDPADADRLMADLVGTVPSAQRIGTILPHTGGPRISLR